MWGSIAATDRGVNPGWTSRRNCVCWGGSMPIRPARWAARAIGLCLTSIHKMAFSQHEKRSVSLDTAATSSYLLSTQKPQGL